MAVISALFPRFSGGLTWKEKIPGSDEKLVYKLQRKCKFPKDVYGRDFQRRLLKFWSPDYVFLTLPALQLFPEEQKKPRKVVYTMSDTVSVICLVAGKGETTPDHLLWMDINKDKEFVPRKLLPKGIMSISLKKLKDCNIFTLSCRLGEGQYDFHEFIVPSSTEYCSDIYRHFAAVSENMQRADLGLKKEQMAKETEIKIIPLDKKVQKEEEEKSDQIEEKSHQIEEKSHQSEQAEEEEKSDQIEEKSHQIEAKSDQIEAKSDQSEQAEEEEKSDQSEQAEEEEKSHQIEAKSDQIEEKSHQSEKAEDHLVRDLQEQLLHLKSKIDQNHQEINILKQQNERMEKLLKEQREMMEKVVNALSNTRETIEGHTREKMQVEDAKKKTKKKRLFPWRKAKE